MACLVLLTPLASVSAFLCTSGASIYASQGQVVEAVSEHLHRIGRVLLQISLRSGRSGLLVRGSLPSFSPLGVAYHQIPLSGLQTSNFLAASSFFSISALLCQVWLKWGNTHQEIRLQGSYQKKAKKPRDQITLRANMVDVREDVGSRKDHVPEQPAETVLPPPPSDHRLETRQSQRRKNQVARSF